MNNAGSGRSDSAVQLCRRRGHISDFIHFYNRQGDSHRPENSNITIGHPRLIHCVSTNIVSLAFLQSGQMGRSRIPCSGG